MPKRKMQDEAEIRRWIDEGRTYAWMVAEYDRKYDLRVSPSMFTNFRARNGLPRLRTLHRRRLSTGTRQG